MEPRKKRKLIPLSGPDGFQKSPIAPKKISVPQFASAFTPSANPSGKSPFKAPHSSLDPQLRNAALPPAEAHLTRLGASTSTNATATTGPSSISTRRGPFIAYKDISLNKRAMLEDLSPAAAAPHIQPAMRKLQAPDLATILQEHYAAAKPTTTKQLKRITSPPLLPTNEGRDKRAKHDFKTLSTTGIAKATDLNTESGNAELASILLYDQHPDIALQGDADRSEARRGLNFSPRKKRYGQQGPQFVRNGLAARASELVSKTRTSLTLWQKEMDAQTNSRVSDDNPISFSHLRPDLRLKVTKIIHGPTSYKPSKSGNTQSQSPCFAIALCRVLQSPGLSTRTTDLSFHTSYHTLVKVIFSFSSSPLSVSIVRNPSLFKTGVEILVWKPWHEVRTSTPSSAPDGTKEIPPALAVDDPVHDQLVPASFPMSLTTSFLPKSEDMSAFRIAGTVLMCTRFVLVRQ